MFDQRECLFICDCFHAIANSIVAARVIFERHIFGVVFPLLEALTWLECW